MNQEVQKEKRANLELSEKYMQMNMEREEHKNNIRELNMRYENVVSFMPKRPKTEQFGYN